MQTRPTRRLAKILACTLKNASYRETARLHGIVLETGAPDPGMVKRLVDGYEPQKPETRQRLGLPPLPYCPECKRRRVSHHHSDARLQPVATSEPLRRVLSGAWRLPSGKWGTIEEAIKETAK